MSKYILLLVTIFTSLYFNAYSQDAKTVLERGGDLDILYRNERNISPVIHTNGVGVNYRRIWHVTGTKKRIIEIEAVNMRHPKEKKISSLYEGGKAYAYGKLNAFEIFRPGIGYQKTLYRRSERKSVEVRLGTFVGASLGFAKPVYLEILYDIPSSNSFAVKEEKYNPDKHYPDRIYGPAPFIKGLNETKFYPGIYSKLALSFEYGDHHDEVKAIETGIVVDAYPKGIPLMAYNKNEQVMLNFYISLIYGKKWF